MRKNQYTMTENALENYGEKWRDVVLEVVHTATKYMPAKEFYEKGKPQGYHPGFDEGLSGQKLYDLKRADTGEMLNYSLYNWELERV